MRGGGCYTRHRAVRLSALFVILAVLFAVADPRALAAFDATVDERVDTAQADVAKALPAPVPPPCPELATRFDSVAVPPRAVVATARAVVRTHAPRGAPRRSAFPVEDDAAAPPAR